MQNSIVFIDSGIGGIPYLRHFASMLAENSYQNQNTNSVCDLCKLVYVADNKNFPYGTKSKEELTKLLIDLTQKINNVFEPAVITLACNTASVSALQELRKTFPGIAFAGTVPAVRPAILASKTNCIGVLGTERTVEDSYISLLAHNTGKNCKVLCSAAPDLVEFVENQNAASNDARRQEIVLPYIQHFRESGADGIVLGCTHFLFLKDAFIKAAGEGITIFDSVAGVCARVKNILQEKNIAHNRLAQGVFALSANPEGLQWQTQADSLHMELKLL